MITFLSIYLITTGVSLIVHPLMMYFHYVEEDGERSALAYSAIDIIICLVPFLCFLTVIYTLLHCYVKIRVVDEIKKWVEADPTSPKNMGRPEFIPPKKVEKFNPIKSRFDILDIRNKRRKKWFLSMTKN